MSLEELVYAEEGVTDKEFDLVLALPTALGCLFYTSLLSGSSVSASGSSLPSIFWS